MRIAYISSDRGIPVYGTKGASIHVRGMAQALVQQGHEVQLLTARADGDPPPGFRPQVIDFGFDRLLKDLRREIRTHGGDNIGNEAYSLLLNTALAQALDRLDRRWGIDAIYERYSLWSWSGLHFARERNLPFILEVNAPLVKEQATWRELSLQPIAAGLERLVLREADAISVPASGLKEHIAAVAGRRRGIHVVPNGVDLAVFRDPQPPPDALLARLRGRFVVAFLGSLKPWHGIENLCRAFRKLHARVPAAHLLVIGDGPMRGYLEETAAELGPDAITLTGAVPHQAVPGLLAAADVGVAPYPELDDFYFCPLKVIEYLTAGLPVVASDLGDMAKLVEHGRTGLLLPPGDTRALADALIELHDHPRRRESFGARARRRAESRHGWEVSARRVEQFISEAAAARAGHADESPAMTGTA
jgi:glycosyltransferase involved in cell wall biosynthesis